MLLKFTKLFLNPAGVFISLSLITGLLSAFMVPQLSTNDENMHFLKAYNLASGDLGSNNCSFPYEVDYKAGAIYQGKYTADYSDLVDFTKTVHKPCGSAAGYSPIMHAPQAIGIFFAKLLYPSTALMVLLGRISNLIFYVLSLYFIIKHVRLGKWVFVVIGLFPLMIHTAASLSADVMNNIVLFAFVAYIFNLFVQKETISKRQTTLLLALVGLMSLTKITNVVLLLPLIFLPKRLFRHNSSGSRVPFNIHKWSICIASGVISVLLVIGWQQIFGGEIVGGSMLDNPLTNDPLRFFEILSNTYLSPFIGYGDIVVRGLVGEFASFRYHLPTFMLVLLFGLFLFTLLHKNKEESLMVRGVSGWFAIGSTLAISVFIVAVTYAMYVNWAILPFRLGPNAGYADGVQGRYFTAALILLVPVFIWLRKFISIETKSDKILGLLVFIVSGSALIFYLVETYLYTS